MKILLNILTHGDERIGLKVVEKIRELNIPTDILQINLANKMAFEKGVRFIETDLNHSFPGKKDGNYEERLAYDILPAIKMADIVFDVHSTTSELQDAAIVTKFDAETKKYLNIISPKYVLFMKQSSKNSLISDAKVGIAFEYGKDDDRCTIFKIVKDIKKS
jgi:predicted deacylase